MTDGSREVVLEGEPVEYTVRESAEAEEPRIDVGIHAIRVVIPEGERVDPEALLTENAAWLLEKKRKFEAYRESAPIRRFEPSETFPFLGEDREVVVEDIPRSHVTEDELRLARSRVEQASIRDALERLYLREARSHLTDRVDHFAGVMNVEPEKVEFRNQRTRWGSCSTNRTISLNWRLLMAPREVIDYVVVHELAHLHVEKHTRRFWSLVEEHVPSYEDCVRWLEDNSARLIFDEDDL